MSWVLGRDAEPPNVPVSEIWTCGVAACRSRGRVSPETWNLLSRNNLGPSELLMLATVDMPWLWNDSRFDVARLKISDPPAALSP